MSIVVSVVVSVVKVFYCPFTIVLRFMFLCENFCVV